MSLMLPKFGDVLVSEMQQFGPEIVESEQLKLKGASNLFAHNAKHLQMKSSQTLQYK
jgi:hypothetical protein